MNEAEKAGAILNIRRNVTLSDGALTMRVRRHRMSEVLEHIQTLGTLFSDVLGQFPAEAKTTAMLPALLRAIGAPAFAIMAQVTEMQVPNPEDGGASATMRTAMPAEIGDLDVEDFAILLDTYTEMHQRAIETFRVALARFDTGKAGASKESNGRSTDSSAPATRSIPSLTPPTTG